VVDFWTSELTHQAKLAELVGGGRYDTSSPALPTRVSRLKHTEWVVVGDVVQIILLYQSHYMVLDTNQHLYLSGKHEKKLQVLWLVMKAKYQSKGYL